jgi:tetratricopeptide (TPR) repeat protein
MQAYLPVPEEDVSAMKKHACCLLVLLLAAPCFGQTPAEGKVIAAQGKVEYRAAQVAEWTAASPLQSLYVKDRLHTAAASKAAVLFRDETQIRLNANSELVVRSLADRKGTSTALELVQGEGWFRTKNPSSDLHVETPGATAAIRGTEINMRIGQDGESVLTVVEGQVEFSNAWGSVTVNAGEEAVARDGQAPTKRLLLDPEDAVQWVIYYPAAVSWHDILQNELAEPVRAGLGLVRDGAIDEARAALEPFAAQDPWARIGLSMCRAQTGEYTKARDVLGETLTGALEVERLSQLAAVAVQAGDIGGAQQLLDAALAIDPAAVRPGSLAVTVALARNRRDRAAEIAAAVLAAHPDSVSANVSAGEVAQAGFDLAAALERFDVALQIDSYDVRARVDRARVLFGVGRTREAESDADVLSRLFPSDSQARSLQGFILLSRGKVEEAAASFTAATETDPTLGEPHLGLGLVSFRKGKPADGLWEMLIATLLDPKVSLYQSYLGKAYFQARRLEEGLAALDSAQRLDPRDPTPHLYKSHFLRDLNRHVDALGELTKAIELNDYRAVYRSRLLLDEDLATKNVSLAQVYRKVGMEAWGVSEALRSLSSDFTNAAAHLFLADLYGDLPDRVQAQVSEFLQYIIFAPVNQNSFAAFGEYTSLLEQPMFSFSGYSEGTMPSLLGVAQPSFSVDGELSTKSGNDFFTHALLLDYKYQVGARPDVPDQSGFGDLQAKVALGLSASLFAHVTYNLADFGADEDEIVTYGVGANQVNISKISTALDPTQFNTQNLLTVSLGGRVDWARGFPFALMAQYQNNVATNGYLTTIAGYLYDTTLELSVDLFDIQAQQILRLGDRLQVMIGMDAFQGNRHYRNPVSVSDPVTGAFIGSWTDAGSSSENGLHGWLWGEAQVLDPLHVSAALFAQADAGEHLFAAKTYHYQGVYPALGVTWDLGAYSVLRAAAFQFRSTRLFPETIYPCSLAGFLVDRNEDIYTLRTEAHVALDTIRSPFFLSNHLYVRSSEYPELSLTLLTKADTGGLATDFDWVIAGFLTLSANNQIEMTSTVPFDEISDQLKTGLTFTLPVGLTVRVNNTLMGQFYVRSYIPELTNSVVDLLDAEARFDFPGKRGYASFAVTNILDQQFTLFTEGLAITHLYPYRRMTLSVDLEL